MGDRVTIKSLLKYIYIYIYIRPLKIDCVFIFDLDPFTAKDLFTSRRTCGDKCNTKISEVLDGPREFLTRNWLRTSNSLHVSHALLSRFQSSWHIPGPIGSIRTTAFAFIRFPQVGRATLHETRMQYLQSFNIIYSHIFTNICPKDHPNVGKYAIPGAYMGNMIYVNMFSKRRLVYSWSIQVLWFNMFSGHKERNILIMTGWWFGTCFPYIWNFIIPTEELIFFRGVISNHQPGIYIDYP